MKVDISNLNETETTAIMARIRQYNGEVVSTIPYIMASILELSGIFRTLPLKQFKQLIKVRNELLFLRTNLSEVLEHSLKDQQPVVLLDDEEAIKAGLSFAAIDGLFEILNTLQEAADERLVEISPSIFEDLGGFNGKLN